MFTKFISRKYNLIKTALIALAASLTVGSALFYFAQPAQAAASLWGDRFTNTTVVYSSLNAIGLGHTDPRVVVVRVIMVILGFMGLICISLIMYAGWMWMMAKGNEQQVLKAKKTLQNTVIGLLIILSAFGIGIYVLTVLLGATGGNGTTLGNSYNTDNPGLGALGSGSLRSVYPAPNATNIPRNTSIIVTFKEDINPGTICDKLDGSKCALDAKALSDSVKLMPVLLGSISSTTVTDIAVQSLDNKTFVFTPKEYLGSPSSDLWYAAELTTKIKKANGQAAFNIASYIWRFQVSSKMDLTPPQVDELGMFPVPDNEQDAVAGIEAAKPGQGGITVLDVPRAAVANRVAYVKTNPISTELDVDNPDGNTCTGQIDLSINSDAPYTVNIAYVNIPGKANEASAEIVDKTIHTACGFDIILAGDPAPGMSWSFNVSAQRDADFLVVGTVKYYFVSSVPGNNEIAVGANPAEMAFKIAQALASNPSVTAEATANSIKLKSKTLGLAGNNVALMTSASNAFKFQSLSGGVEAKKIINVKGKKDQPKNSIIQINFNEAVDPTYLSGDSESVKDFIRVIDTKTNTRIAGTFYVSNSYKTVEFFPSLECGVNGCGEKIYCLPGDTQIKVELVAARLTASCATDDDCAKRVPFNKCQSNVCSDSQGAKYPEGQLASGIFDLARNSLDGNKNNKAEGPASFYSANAPQPSQGDSYVWSFWISSEMDLTAPEIISIDPIDSAKGVGAEKPVLARFNKVLSATNLSSGEAKIKNGDKEVVHKLVNLRALDKTPLGYWIEKIDEDSSSPADGQADRTTVVIRHSNFSESTIYRAQVGSGVKDIYQNCYKPCKGNGCQADSSASSCCKGVPTKTGADSVCP